MRRRWQGWIAAPLLALSFSAAAEGISVQGEAELRMLPERADLQIGIEHRADSANRAMEEVGRVAARFIEAARDIGAGDKQLRSSDVQVMPEYRWNEERREREQRGFVARRDIQLRVEQLDRLSDYLRAAAATGVTHVSRPELSVADPAAARREALAAATRDARANADAIAEAAGRELGALISLDAQPERQAPSPIAMRAASAEIESADSGSGIAFGEIVHKASVRAQFALAAP